MNNILITGAGSFIGSNFLKYSKNRQVREVSLIDNHPDQIDFKNIDVVLHLAAIVHQSKKISEKEYFKVNRDLCLSVADRAKRNGVKQFVFLSSVKVYGDSESSDVPKNETSECSPDDSYGRSKYEAERDLMKMNDPDFMVSIVRTPLVYGERVKANMINLIKLVDRVPVLPFGKIKNRRSFTYVENLVGFIDRIIEKRASGIFIAMDGSSLSTTELVESISGHLGKKTYHFKMPWILLKISSALIPGKLDKLYGSYEFENSSTRNILEFEPPFSTDEGLRRTVVHYLKAKNNHNQS
jgi:UDP-glucose 4-epimerase